MTELRGRRGRSKELGKGHASSVVGARAREVEGGGGGVWGGNRMWLAEGGEELCPKPG